MSLIIDLARFRISLLNAADLPALALAALEEGFESPSQIILAGKNADENPFALEEYLQMALKELKLSLYSDRASRLIGTTANRTFFFCTCKRNPVPITFTRSRVFNLN